MDIKCWGSRGSIPVSGKEFIKYGGDTTCIEVTAKSSDTVIIDAGTGIRGLGNAMVSANQNVCHLFFTHVHWDHILGFPFFAPLLQKGYQVNIANHRVSGKPLKEILSGLMSDPFFPITINDFMADIRFIDMDETPVSIGSLRIETIALSHSNSGVGYRISEEDKSFVFLTDNELGFAHPGRVSTEEYIRFSQDADLLLHDAEFTHEEYQSRKGWGHSSADDVLDLAVKAGVKKLGLFHLNQNRDDDQVEQMEAYCRQWLKMKDSAMDCFAVPCLMEFQL
ncbi:MAG: MBL fold metallo-hydrolase [Desulfobacteraceae bacterium]|nr:MAG: MBL fold metallo-hydrolase [Desulfobacteraceae bacterium]